MRNNQLLDERAARTSSQSLQLAETSPPRAPGCRDKERYLVEQHYFTIRPGAGRRRHGSVEIVDLAPAPCAIALAPPDLWKPTAPVPD